MFRHLAVLIALLLSVTGTTYAQEEAPTKEPPAVEKTDIPSWVSEPVDLGEGRNFTKQFVQMLLSLGLVILLMFGGAWILKRLLNQRMIQANTSSAMKILERRALSPKSAIYLLDISGTGVVVGESPAGLHRITEISLESEGKKPTRKNFDSIYKQQGEERHE